MWLYLEHRVFADGIKFRCSHTGVRWALRPVTSVFTRERGEFGYRDTDEPQERKPGKEKQRLEQCRCQGTLPGRGKEGSFLEFSQGAHPANTLILDFEPPKLRTHFCCFKPFILWSPVMAAIGNEYTPQPPNHLLSRARSLDNHSLGRAHSYYTMRRQEEVLWSGSLCLEGRLAGPGAPSASGTAPPAPPQAGLVQQGHAGQTWRSSRCEGEARHIISHKHLLGA